VFGKPIRGKAPRTVWSVERIADSARCMIHFLEPDPGRRVDRGVSSTPRLRDFQTAASGILARGRSTNQSFGLCRGMPRLAQALSHRGW
jgi:hypothetical protein